VRGVLTDASTSTFGYSVCPCHIDIGASNDISCFSSRQDGFQMCIYFRLKQHTWFGIYINRSWIHPSTNGICTFSLPWAEYLGTVWIRWI